jgi:ribonuclease P protein subunit POP4
MKVTAEIVHHEFIGTEGKIIKSTHPSYVGMSGKIVDETRNTFTLLTRGEKKMIMKNSTIYHFRFPDGTIVEVYGKLLVGRPEDRLKKNVRRLW